MQHLKIQFRATQDTSLKVRTDLIRLSQVYGLGSSELFQGMSIDQYIVLLKQTYEKNLSDELLENILKSNPSKSILNSMIISLEKQHTELITIETMVSSKLLLT